MNQTLSLRKKLPPEQFAQVLIEVNEIAGPQIPNHWQKGQLLNVRNTGVDYVLTILGEEFDHRHPERALRFSNSSTCNDFLGHWYSRQSHDPRAC